MLLPRKKPKKLSCFWRKMAWLLSAEELMTINGKLSRFFSFCEKAERAQNYKGKLCQSPLTLWSLNQLDKSHWIFTFTCVFRAPWHVVRVAVQVSELTAVVECFVILSRQGTVTCWWEVFPHNLWHGFDFRGTLQINEFSFVMLQMRSFQETSHLDDKVTCLF